jgi:drug/metabolite transporter (DMT)-like permease
MSGNPVPESSHLRALVWIAPCVVAWSFIPRLASNPANLDPHQYLFWSSVVSAACLLACTGLLGRWQALRAYSGTDLRRIIALASLGAFGYCALLYSAYAPCTGGECPGKTHLVIIVHYTWPALSVLWSTVLLRDRLTGPMILSLLLGVLAVAIGASTTASPGDALSRLPAVLLAAVIFGLYSTLLKRVDYEPFSSHAVTFGTAAVLSCVAMSVMSERWTFPNPDAVVAVLVNGALVNALSYVCWYRVGRAHASPGRYRRISVDVAERRALGRHRPRAVVGAPGDGSAKHVDRFIVDRFIVWRFSTQRFIPERLAVAPLETVRVESVRAGRRIALIPSWCRPRNLRRAIEIHAERRQPRSVGREPRAEILPLSCRGG